MAGGTNVDLSLHFTSDQLKCMSSYERTRNENLIRNHQFMKSIGLPVTDPSFQKKSGQTEKPAASCRKRTIKLVRTKNQRKDEDVAPKKRLTRERKQVKRFQPPPVKLQIEKQIAQQSVSVNKNDTGFNDSFEEFANKVQFDGTLADDDYDPKDFEWSSDEKESDKENFSEEEVKPAKCRKVKISGVKKAKAKPRHSPVRFAHNNIKMLFDHKKMLPRRKCAASVQSYKEDDVETDDSFIYCEECQLEFVDNCLIHPLIPMGDTQVLLGVEDRARKTLPTGLSLSKSKIKDAGKGVWTDIKIPQFTRFGPYEGVKQPVKDIKQDQVSGYGWLVTDKTDPFYIDGQDEKQSNWLRYVNCARTKQEQNCEAFQYKGQIYYKALINIGIGHELLVWYGDDYAADLGISKDNFSASIIPATPKESMIPEGTVFYDCEICKAKFVNKSSVTRHMRWHNQKQGDKECKAVEPTDPPCLIKCEECDFRCVLQKELTKHSKYHNDKYKYTCEICDARFATAQNLQIHMRTHTGEKPYACTQCDARFTQAITLQRHMRTHTGEKPYACTQCDARFTQAAPLQTHMRTHTGEKPYPCTQCEAKFSLAQNLQAHMRTHTGEKPYACTQCDARFNERGNMQKHMKSHTGEKPYACTQCVARFIQASYLKIHMRTHTGEKPYACTQCDARFTRTHSLQAHIRTHTGEKPYACTQCDARFSVSRSLHKHIKVTHIMQ